MGGTSSSTTSQSASTSPWATGQGVVNSLLGQLNPAIANSGINGAQTGALNSIESNTANPYASGIQGATNSLLSGGGANNQAGAVNQNFQNYQANTNPLASNTNYDPMQTPGIGTQLSGLSNSIMSNVNGQFAAAGRDGSPANSQAAAYGLSQGLAPILTNQYNQNVQNQQGAAGNLYSAGNNTSGILSGMNQQGLSNQQAGSQLAPTALSANNYGANQTLAAEAQRQGIPIQNLGLLSQIGIPIAGLGTNSSGTSNTQNQMSGTQQFASILGGLGSLMPKGPTSFNF